MDYVTSGAPGNGQKGTLIAWQPSTWPPADPYQLLFAQTLDSIFKESLLAEIQNVIDDATTQNGGLQHRGHVVAIALFCATDALGAYAFNTGVGKRFRKFVEVYFPSEYQVHSVDLYAVFRNSVVHSWNLFSAGMTPGNEVIRLESGTLRLGLLNYFEALKHAANNLVEAVEKDSGVEACARKRYEALRATACP
jgi:hypothetical protein